MTHQPKERLDKLYNIAVNRSFFYPSNEIYGSIAGFYDYGPIGVKIRKNILNKWRKTFVTNDVLEVETSTILPEIVLKASGHVDGFSDPIVYCKKCRVKFRADHLIQAKEDGFSWDGSLETIDKKIKEHKLKCPNCGGDLSESKTFNLMFKTGIGADESPAYNRPETAQGIFTSFTRMFRSFGMRLPLIIAQTGKSFRNEISPRQGLVRMREFTQMELEYFYDPDNPTHSEYESLKNNEVNIKYKGERKLVKVSELLDYGVNQIMAVYIAKEWDFFSSLGLDKNRIWFRILEDSETPHYSSKNVDFEAETSYGIIELDGNALRTNFDLNRHMKFSKKDLSVFVESKGKKLVPYVYELSIGLDRLFYTILDHTLRTKSDEKNWEWFDLPPSISPYLLGIFSLVKKDGLLEKGQELYEMINNQIPSFFNARGSIGKRYARADEIGVPYCITLDYQTLEDNTVTIRMRNDGWQTRIKVSDIVPIVKKLEKEGITNKKELSTKEWFNQMFLEYDNDK